MNPLRVAGAFSGSLPLCRRMTPKAKHRTNNVMLTMGSLPAFLLAETSLVSRLGHLQRPSWLGRNSVAEARLAARRFRHTTPGALCIFDGRKWTEDAFRTLYDVIES